MPKVIDITGNRYGRLVVLGMVEKPPKNKSRKTFWECQCDCGNKTTVCKSNLVSGTTKSCGCLQRESSINNLSKISKENQIKANKTHGKSNTKLYDTYHHMLRRCYNEKDAHFKEYGMRGIKVCDEWKQSFESFYEWAMENGYNESLTIDRIDVNGNYCPDNCRFVDRVVQANNRRSNVFATIDGKTKTLSEWAKESGLAAGTVWFRYKHGKRGEQLIAPVRGKG